MQDGQGVTDRPPVVTGASLGNSLGQRLHQQDAAVLEIKQAAAAQHHNFVSTVAGAVVVDAAPYFGHHEIDLALVDYFNPVPDHVFEAYQDIAPIDPGFAKRRELWRMFGYLAVVTVDGHKPFGRRILTCLAEAVSCYR